MFNKVLIANRGVIASRIIRALKELGISSVAVYSEADKDLPYLKEADETYFLGGANAQESYLNQDKLLEIIQKEKVDAVHPGYGFLAENTEFVKKLEKIGVKFIGPSSKWISLMADKNKARSEMANYSMPIGKGSNSLTDNVDEILAEAEKIGYPVLVKPANGGGGIGMFPVAEPSQLIEAVKKAKSLAERYFSDSSVYLEKFFDNPRHIEFQVLADMDHNIRHLYERDCSIQRRHQKVIEESPAPNIDKREIIDIAQKIEESIKMVGYDNIGTVEMLRSQDGSYSFLEMNTRLQVEHAVTEEVLGVDLVKLQIQSAAGKKLTDLLPDSLNRIGHSIEARIYAEDPITFYPSPGKLEKFILPEMNGIRVETGYEQGNSVSPYYDPLIIKVIAFASSRDEAVSTLTQYLDVIEIEGIKTNIPFIIYALQSEEFQHGNVHTNLAEELTKRMKKESKIKL